MLLIIILLRVLYDLLVLRKDSLKLFDFMVLLLRVSSLTIYTLHYLLCDPCPQVTKKLKPVPILYFSFMYFCSAIATLFGF